MADLDGAPLGIRAARNLAGIDAAAHFAVCQPGAAIAPHFADLGYNIVENPNANLGLSSSLHLAVGAAAKTKAQALLIVLADMPFIMPAHINALIAACDHDIIASTDGGQAMPPAIFPRATWPLLLEHWRFNRDRLSKASFRKKPHGFYSSRHCSIASHGMCSC
jgi:CTP:molybdopterin cytidylyltransferase MocA